MSTEKISRLLQNYFILWNSFWDLLIIWLQIKPKRKVKLLQFDIKKWILICRSKGGEKERKLKLHGVDWKYWNTSKTETIHIFLVMLLFQDRTLRTIVTIKIKRFRAEQGFIELEFIDVINLCLIYYRNPVPYSVVREDKALIALRSNFHKPLLQNYNMKQLG